MRESRIDGYKPGFRAPLYPWLQIAGVVIALWLISEMGLLAITFTGALLLGCGAWYRWYAAERVIRRGAIFHVHQRLGEKKFEGLEREFMTIIHDRTEEENLTYEALIARSAVVDLQAGLIDNAHLSTLLGETARERFEAGDAIAATFTDSLAFRPVGEGVYMSIAAAKDIDQPELVVCRFGPEVDLSVVDVDLVVDDLEDAHTLLFLVSPIQPVGLDLRLAVLSAEVVQSDHFAERWLNAKNDKALNAILMRDDHFFHGPVETMPFLVEQLGRTISELDLPSSCIVALIERDGELVIPTPGVRLLAFDGIAIIGEPDDIAIINAGLDPFEAESMRRVQAEQDAAVDR